MKNLLTIIVLYLLLTISQAWSLPPCEGDESKWQDCEGSLTSASGTIYIGVFKDGIFEGKNEEKSVRYLGEYKNGTQNGQGTYTWGGKYEGQTYVGGLKDGKTHGQGTLTFADGSKYVGEYKNGKQNGQGTYTSSDSTTYVGGWKDGKFNGQGTYTFVNGNKYVGEWKDGKTHGQGTYTYANGDKYVGEYKDNMRHGQGTYTYADGKVWEGQWRNGECPDCQKYAAGEYTGEQGGKLHACEGVESKWQNCEGSITSASGTIYIGVFKDGIFDGKNEERNIKYVGEYKNGTQNGQGTYTFASGEKYVGELKDGKFNGQGTWTFPNGDKYVGEYKDNR